MTDREKEIILHASGLSQNNNQYREHYCSDVDDPILTKLVAEGYFRRPVSSVLVRKDNAFFFLTAEGIAKAWELKRAGGEG